MWWKPFWDRNNLWLKSLDKPVGDRNMIKSFADQISSCSKYYLIRTFWNKVVLRSKHFEIKTICIYYKR